MHKIEQEKALWEFRLHAENILTNRTNFFLIAQSFFAMAAATLVNTASTASLSHLLLLFISAGGFVVSSIWFVLGFKIYSRLGRIDNEVKKFFGKFRKMMEETETCYSSNWFIAIAIPGLFVIGWLLFLFYFLVYN